MLILNPTPMPSFSQLHNHLNQLFNTMLCEGQRCASSIAPPASVPPMNVWEDETSFRIEAELPGFDIKDIDITVMGDEVAIKGERKVKEQEGATYLRRERAGGSFTRTWTLPAEVVADKVEATLRDGVLQITLPKSEQAMPRKIQVKATSR